MCQDKRVHSKGNDSIDCYQSQIQWKLLPPPLPSPPKKK